MGDGGGGEATMRLRLFVTVIRKGRPEEAAFDLGLWESNVGRGRRSSLGNPATHTRWRQLWLSLEPCLMATEHSKVYTADGGTESTGDTYLTAALICHGM